MNKYCKKCQKFKKWIFFYVQSFFSLPYDNNENTERKTHLGKVILQIL